MASPVPRHNITQNNHCQDLRTFFVFHINRGAPEELHIDSVQAPDAAEARNVAERLFPANAILQIRKDGNEEAPLDVGGYPSARFINGKFHGAFFDEDEMEPEYE